MPIAILLLLIANLASAQVGGSAGNGLGRITSTLALSLLVVRFGRSGELGAQTQHIIRAKPAWIFLTLGIGLIALETWLDTVITDAGASLAMRRVTGPLGFGLIISGTEIWAYNRSLR